MKKIIVVLFVALLTLSVNVSAFDIVPGTGGVHWHAGWKAATYDTRYRTLNFRLDFHVGSSVPYSIVFPKDEVYPDDEVIITFTQMANKLHEKYNIDGSATLKSLKQQGFTLYAIPTIEIYGHESGNIYDDFNVESDIEKIARDKYGFGEPHLTNMHEEFNFGNLAAQLVMPVTPSASPVKISANANMSGFSGASGTNKIKSGYGFGLSNGSATLTSTNPAIGGWVSTGWSTKSQLTSVKVNSISSFKFAPGVSAITGIANGHATTSSSLTPSTNASSIFYWNWSDNKTYSSSPVTLFNFSLFQNSFNPYSRSKSKMIYIPQNTTNGNYTASAGSGSTANITLNWDNYIWETDMDGNGNWEYAGSASVPQDISINPFTLNYQIDGSMFDDDTSTVN